MEEFNQVVDFHIHAIGSRYKDSDVHASSNYNQLCAYFQKMAEIEDKNFVIAITEHENSIITFDEYKALQEKYPNVKLVLGMEVNTKLSYQTDGIFEKAHVLIYADMTSDETVKKWLDNPELKALSKINTFRTKFPSNYYTARVYLSQINKSLGLKLDAKTICLRYMHTKYDQDKLKKDLRKIIEESINKLGYPEERKKQIISYIPRVSTKVFSEKIIDEKLGTNLYVAKNILNKYLNLDITNIEIARLLDETLPREKINKIFLKFVRNRIHTKNPALYNKIKNMTLFEFSNYTLGKNEFGPIMLSTFVPKNRFQMNTSHLDYKEIRTRLKELDKIVKQTGGHMLLAHPEVAFTVNNETVIKKEHFDLMDRNVVSRKKYEEMSRMIAENGSIPSFEISGKNSLLARIDLLFKMCRQKGINFEGFEVTKADLYENQNFVNKLIYAAKNNLDISFGSDTHLSNMYYYYTNLYSEGKISKETYDDLLQKAKEIGDTIALNGYFKKLYVDNIRTNNVVKEKSRVVKPCLKNKERKYIPVTNSCKVLETSFANKLLEPNKKSNSLFTVEYRNEVLEFDRNILKTMNYNFDFTKQRNKNNDKDMTM